MRIHLKKSLFFSFVILITGYSNLMAANKSYLQECNSIKDSSIVKNGNKIISKTGCHIFEAIHGENEITARAVCLHIIKDDILSEMGTYIESESLLKRNKADGVHKKSFESSIKAITGGIVKTKIIDQRWLDKNHTKYYLKASVTADNAELTKAISEISRNQDLLKKLQDSQEEIETAFNKIETLQKKLNKEAKINIDDYYKKEIDAILAEEMYQKGEALVLNRQFSKAVLIFDRAIKLNNDHARSYFGRAFARMAVLKRINASNKNHIARLNSSIKDYGKAIKLDPKLSKARDNLFSLYNAFAISSFKNKKFNKGIRLLDHAISIMNGRGSNSAMSTAHKNRALAFIKLKKYQLALNDCNKAIYYTPEYADAYMQKVIIYNNLLKHGDKSVIKAIRNNLVTAALLGNKNARSLYNKNFKPPVKWPAYSALIIGTAIGSKKPEVKKAAEKKLMEIGFPLNRIKKLIKLAVTGDKKAKAIIHSLGIKKESYNIKNVKNL